MQHPHHRFWAGQGLYPAPPSGVIAGGLNAHPEDETAIAATADMPEAARYIDNFHSYSTNEVAINWNGPLVWVDSFAGDT